MPSVDPKTSLMRADYLELLKAEAICQGRRGAYSHSGTEEFGPLATKRTTQAGVVCGRPQRCHLDRINSCPSKKETKEWPLCAIRYAVASRARGRGVSGPVIRFHHPDGRVSSRMSSGTLERGKNTPLKGRWKQLGRNVGADFVESFLRRNVAAPGMAQTSALDGKLASEID
ncbi:unnamed protein product [Nezara viridula]|uniref:Uncharacterized protein n=1 Tax=Nezara viridula TaxID=85310 RepID=A0A9P0HD17_NEZVI|nr:unnamed protein product [Nezara viridula]